MPRRSESIQTFNARLPKDIHSRLVEAVNLSKRSINGEILERLRRSFEGDDIRSIIREELHSLSWRLTCDKEPAYKHHNS